ALMVATWLRWRRMRRAFGEARTKAPGPADEGRPVALVGRLRRDHDDDRAVSWQIELEDGSLRLEGPLTVRGPLVRRWPDHARSDEALVDGAPVWVRGCARYGGDAAGYRERRRVAVALVAADDGLELFGATPPRLRMSGRGWA